MKTAISERKWFKKTDLIILLAVLLVAAALLLMNKNNNIEGKTAQITSDSKVVKEIMLNTAVDEIFTLKENPNISFEIKNGKIRFVGVDCPDKLCENFGFLSKTNEVAVCLPNKVTLRIIGENSDIDAVVN